MKHSCKQAILRTDFYFYLNCFLLNGAEIKRQIGFNFDLVENQLEQITDFHYNKAGYIGSSGDQWERFYDSFDRWAQSGEYDRDALIILYYCVT